VKRQSALLEEGRGDEIVQETRLWDEGKLETFTMRKKEGLADYRYFPEPDLPALVLTEEDIEAVRGAMEELPGARRERYGALGLKLDDVLFLSEDADVSGYFDAAVAAGAPVKLAANWIMGDLAAHCKSEKCAFGSLLLTPEVLAELTSLIEDDVISGKIGKEVLPELLAGAGGAGGGSVRAFVESKGLVQQSDPEEIKAIIRRAMEENPGQLEQYRGGKNKLAGYFQGQCMKLSGGTVNPKLLSQLLKPMLDGEVE